MARSRASAKAAGSTFERSNADYMAKHVNEYIDRRVKSGANDKGDIGGVRAHGQRVVVECKNEATMKLGTWVAEAEKERLNDEAIAAMVIHKRKGKSNPGEQYVTMLVDDVIALLTGVRPTEIEDEISDVLRTMQLKIASVNRLISAWESLDGDEDHVKALREAAQDLRKVLSGQG